MIAHRLLFKLSNIRIFFQPEFFFRLSFHNCISCVYNCDDLPSNNSSLHSSHIWFSYIHNFIKHLLRIYNTVSDLQFTVELNIWMPLYTVWRRNWTSQFFKPIDHANLRLKLYFFMEGHFKHMPQLVIVCKRILKP